MRRRPLIPTVLAVAALGLGLAACSEDGETVAPVEPAPAETDGVLETDTAPDVTGTDGLTGTDGEGDLEGQAGEVRSELERLVDELAATSSVDELRTTLSDSAERLRQQAAGLQQDVSADLEDERTALEETVNGLADELEAAAGETELTSLPEVLDRVGTAASDTLAEVEETLRSIEEGAS